MLTHRECHPDGVSGSEGAILGAFAAGMIYDRTESYALRHHNIAAHLRGDDFVADQAVGKHWNARSDANSLKALVRLIRLSCQTV
jgi:hypothetical protein